MNENEFTNVAKDLVVDEIQNYLTAGETKKPKVYVVWLVKVLENNKCLISTHEVDGYYWEVTYNGLKGEFYVDRYYKENNRMVKRQAYKKHAL